MRETKTYTLVLDDLRVALYGYFLFLIGLGYLITKFGSDVLNMKGPNLLDWWWGTTNVCIFFDFPPSNYVLPAFYTIFIIIFCMMSLLLWVRQKEAVLAGQISRGWYWFLNYLRISEVLAACYFLTIFAVSPDVHEMATQGTARTLIHHTVPFACFVIAMSTLTLSDFIYDCYTGFASVLGLTAGKRKAPWYFYVVATYPIVFALFSIVFIFMLLNPFFKYPDPIVPWHMVPELWNATINQHNGTDIYSWPCLTNDWLNDPTCSGLAFCANCKSFLTYGAIIDKGWTFLVLIPPMMKSLVSSIWFRDRIFKISFPVQPHYFEDHPFMIEADVSDASYVTLERI